MQLSAPVRDKVLEVAERLRRRVPEALLSRERLVAVVRTQAADGGAALCAVVLAALPDVEPGESAGAYGERVLMSAMVHCGRPMRREGGQYVCDKCGASNDPNVGLRPVGVAR
ncbi:hypothetical protein DIZ27_38930 [Streptomyces sp. NWU339]|nr:hypothetical protein DIZ27_38930 [Streptomyces sp. NWU339]